MTVMLIRHASAGDREDWPGNDRHRPLDKKGHKQAKKLVDLLARYEVDRVLSSPFDRCVQSVEPLAHARGLEIELRDELGEELQLGAGAALVQSLLPENAVVCGHGGLSDVLVGESQKKGETFVLDERGRLVGRMRP
jgi:8-oxo-(d)GTP phosphatase